MTQIIEFTKHEDKYLIHHYEFECNDSKTIGLFAGNCSLNKFMSLHDWHQIIDNLSDVVQNYAQTPTIQPDSCQRQIIDTNFALNISWKKLDATFYSKLLQSLDFNYVFPYVLAVHVSLRSNVDRFVTNVPIKSPVCRTTNSNAKKTPKKRSAELKESSKVITNDLAAAFAIRDCCVRLPMLQLDENGQLLQNGVRNKRKHSSIVDDEDDIQPVRITSDENQLFMSSTPFVRNINVALKPIENDVHKSEKRSAHRLTTTPRSSNDRKTSSQFNPRIRLLKMPENMDTSKSSKRKNSKTKATAMAKANGKAKKSKKLKVKVRSVANESELFETPTGKVKKSKSKKSTKTSKSKAMPESNVDEIVKIEECDLKLMTEAELYQSYEEHSDLISNLFLNYLKQTDPAVRRAGDYNHFDVLSLLSTDQFSIMLDILFEKLVKIGEFGETDYDTFFLELLIPEWTLAIYMRRQYLEREAAINQIISQKSNQNQTSESFSTLITIRLDDTDKNVTNDVNNTDIN